MHPWPFFVIGVLEIDDDDDDVTWL